MKNVVKKVAAPVVLSLLPLAFLACGQGGGGSTPIKAAPQTATGQKISTCASTLSADGKTVQGTEAKVCRDKGGTLTDVKVPVLFSAIKKDKRVGVYQTIVFKVTRRDAEGNPIEIDEKDREAVRARGSNENDVEKFLTQVCRPIAAKVFSRSELAGTAIFRRERPGDDWAQPSTEKAKTQGARGQSSDDPFDTAMAAPPQNANGNQTVPTAPTNSAGSVKGERPTKRSSQPVYARSSEFHSILDLDITGEGNERKIKVVDEVDAVATAIVILEKPSEEQLRFCNQLVLRVGENFGLTKGRDCASREKEATAAPGEKESPTGTALMKSGNNLNLDPVKVSDAEMLDVLKPVCGSL